MSTTQRPHPYVYVTWLAGLLADDDKCRWAAWFKSHFKFTKVERKNGDLARWKRDHGAMVDGIAHQFGADGWDVRLESQNELRIVGQTGIEVSGKLDVLAVTADEAVIVDAKGGKRKDKDWWQVAIYLVLAPMMWPTLKGRRLRGEVHYADHVLRIEPEEINDAVRKAIIAQIQEAGGAAVARKVPSYRECQFCDIGKGDCPERVEQPEGVATTDLF